MKTIDVDKVNEGVEKAIRAGLKCTCGNEARKHSRVESSEGVWFYAWCFECGMQKCAGFHLPV